MAGRYWTQEEIQMLDELRSTYTVAEIAKRLGRSFQSVNQKMCRMGFTGFEKSTDLLTLHQLCLMMGVESRTVKKKWKNKGLRILRRGNYVVIHQGDLIRYLKRHPEDWNATRVTDDSLFMGYAWYKEKKRVDEKKQYYWTTREVSTLKLLRYQGYSCREIAEKMGRSVSSIKCKLYTNENQRRKKQHDISIG